MTRWSWAICALVSSACNHDSKPSTVPGEMLDGHADRAAPADAAPVSVATAEPAALAPDAACGRFALLASQGCAWSERFPVAFRDPANCLRSLETWFSQATKGHDLLQRTVACWSQDCEDAAACMVRVQQTAPPPGPRACGDTGTAPIFVDDATWAARRGGGAKRFADVHTTVEQPVELCGVEGEVDWITHVTCANGSNPIGTPEQANERRDSWMARGGHCNSVLDRYTVPCPEATYVIHIDRYVCPLGATVP